jgi:hypothetical protein
MTMDTASFNKLSPKMMVYSFGSTLYWLKIAKIVTGSVAESVDPKIRHSSNPRLRSSRPRKDQMYTRTLRCAVINGPVKHGEEKDAPYAYGGDEGTQKCKREDGAKVAEEVGLGAGSERDHASHDKTYLAKLIARVEDDRWEEEVEEQCMLERLHVRLEQVRHRGNQRDVRAWPGCPPVSRGARQARRTCRQKWRQESHVSHGSS